MDSRGGAVSRREWQDWMRIAERDRRRRDAVLARLQIGLAVVGAVLGVVILVLIAVVAL